MRWCGNVSETKSREASCDNPHILREGRELGFDVLSQNRNVQQMLVVCQESLLTTPLIIILQFRKYYYLHFTDRETEAHRY
jgi:hypothetical protein